MKLLRKGVGRISLLGVMPGDTTDILIKNPRTIKVLDILEKANGRIWFKPTDDFLDFIDVNATLDEEHGQNPTDYKKSDYTPIKQDSLRAALSQQINLVIHITKRWYDKGSTIPSYLDFVQT